MTHPHPILRRTTVFFGWSVAFIVLFGASLAITASRALAQEKRVEVRTVEASAPPVVFVGGVRFEGDLSELNTLDIHSVSFQLRMLDALAGNAKLLGEYTHAYRAYQAGQRDLARLREERDRLREEADFVTFQLKELDELDLQAGEAASLAEELSTLERAEDIKRVLGGAGTAIVEDERSVVAQLRDLQPPLENLRGVNQALDQLLERLESAVLELEDAGQALVDIAEDTEYDAERIEEAQSRLDAIYRLQQKHGLQEPDDLLGVREQYAGRMRDNSTVERGIKSLEESLATQRKVLVERALELRTRREGVVADFLARVHERLGKLSMANARLEIAFEPLEEPGPTGLDQVEYLFSANKGSAPQQIKGVASGGELSRLTLAVKSLVAASIPLPTLIFDEIDAGVSGDVALRMGEILHELSAQHQVVTITHSPQVASRADRHYFVFKEDAGERTVTRVRELDRGARVQAIAVMLSSDPPSKPAIANAKGLLASARA